MVKKEPFLYVKAESTAPESEGEVEQEAMEEEDAEFTSDDISELPVIVGLSTGEKFIAEFAEDVDVENCITFFRPLRIIELVDDTETKLRFAMYNPFLQDNLLPIQVNHIVFLTSVSKEGVEIYDDYCKELEAEEYKEFKKQQRTKQKKKIGNVVTLPVINHKSPE